VGINKYVSGTSEVLDTCDTQGLHSLFVTLWLLPLRKINFIFYHLFLIFLNIIRVL